MSIEDNGTNEHTMARHIASSKDRHTEAERFG